MMQHLITVLIFFSLYGFYWLFSTFILKPFIMKKASKQIGGEFELSKDPLLLILAIFFTLLALLLIF